MLSSKRRIEALLRKAQLEYSLTDKGNFRLVAYVGEDRSQVVYISPKTCVVGDDEIVEIWSPAYTETLNQQDRLALHLLLASDEKKIGAWQAFLSDARVTFVFVAKVPLSTLTPNFLRAVCAYVAATADKVEDQLTDEDYF